MQIYDLNFIFENKMKIFDKKTVFFPREAVFYFKKSISKNHEEFTLLLKPIKT